VRLATALPTAGATAVVTAAADRAVRFLASAPATRSNYRGRPVTLVAGPVATAIALTAVGCDRRVRSRVRVAALVAGGGAAAVGLLDDWRGTSDARGIRGHLAAAWAGTITTGALKVVGIGACGLAAATLAVGGRPWRRVAAGAVIAGSANLLNLLDLRPGRALKALLVATPAIGGGSSAEAMVEALRAVAVGALPGDLRERTMLGDTGANGLGALMGVAAVCDASDRRLITSLAVVVALNVASELVSFSSVIDATPPLRWLDRAGRG
jgi:UDP-N-acetylmuramyl pentapeptide phosphotransferase/UDP-N-acetylglucosamine-1-phosphate transferase